LQARTAVSVASRWRAVGELESGAGGWLDRPAGEFDTHETVSARKSPSALAPREFQAVAKALADPRRMALLECIASAPEYSCQQLCSESGVTKGTVSHHVRELVRAGLIDERKDGQYMFYEVRRDVLAAYTAELLRRVARVKNG
jgi:ArsR family transcriptional regulator